MQAPQIPSNEAARLETLHGLNILDTPPEDRFDRYTRLSTRVFDVPIALISLVDRYRQWFKSKQGIDVDETPREQSFCGHAILGDELFEIRNARRDPRFRDNPMVAGWPHIRFYAGAPLITPDGHRLGTLCIIDRVRRYLDEGEREMLTDMADMIVGEMVDYIDPETNLMNRVGLRSLGSRALGEADDEAQPRLLLFDISHYKHSLAPDPKDHSGTDLFAQMLRQRFPDARVIAHMSGGNFAVMLDDSQTSDEDGAIRQLSTEAIKLLQHGLASEVLPIFVGSIAYDALKHHSIDEWMREADALFFKRAQQRLFNNATPV